MFSCFRAKQYFLLPSFRSRIQFVNHINSNEMDIDDPAVFFDVDRVLSNGCTMSEIYRGLNPYELKNVPDIHHSSEHTVLFNMPLGGNATVPPKPYRGHANWDSLHVRLPCSPKNQYPVSNPDGTEEIKDRWTLITDALEQKITTSCDLEAAILSYNAKYGKAWRFRGLHKMIAEMPDDGREHFFGFTLPGIIGLALQLPELVTCAIPLLKCGTNRSVSFSQQQVASLVANAFLCTFPRRNTQKKNSEYRTFPDINFNRLFQSTDSCVLEKIKCILHYFQRVTTKVPTGVVTVTRRCKSTKQMPEWDMCSADFKHVKLNVAADGTIEDQGIGLLQVDFANKYLGGGVLGQGCVQEEIRFVICPELFVTKLIAEVMQPNEALFMVGCERFSNYHGYASSFTFAGEFNDDTPWDESRRRHCTIVALDALNFHRSADQYREDLMRRELDKAFVGYSHSLGTPAPAVATGNWGCGAFGGEKRLKALLQLMVCAATTRPMVYYTFGDLAFRQELLNMWYILRTLDITVAHLWTYLKKFQKTKLHAQFLYSFIIQSHHTFMEPHIPDDKPSASAQQTKTVSSAAQPAKPVSSTSLGFKLGVKSNKSSASGGSSSAETPLPSGSGYRLGSASSAVMPPQPKVQTGPSLLLSFLDNDYFGREQTATYAPDVAVSVTPSTDVDCASQTSIKDGQKNDATDECKNSEDFSVETAVAMLTTAQEMTAVSGDDEDEVIPATPPRPAAPPRSKTAPERKSLHERQKKISDFLLRK